MNSNVNFINNQMQMNNITKYKSVLCKHYDTPNGCQYREKCQFAHGATELRSSNSMMQPTMNSGTVVDSSINAMKKLPNPQNYKIVKCKNYEKGLCKYGALCTFAHGETELRTKIENSMVTQTMSPSTTTMNQQYMPDMFQMQMLQQQMMMMNPNLLKEMQPFMGNMGQVDFNSLSMNQMGSGMNPNMMDFNSMNFNQSGFVNPYSSAPTTTNDHFDSGSHSTSTSHLNMNMNNMYNYQNFPSKSDNN